MYSANIIGKFHFKLINVSQRFCSWRYIDCIAEKRRPLAVPQDDADPIAGFGIGNEPRRLRSSQPRYRLYFTIVYPLQCLSGSTGQMGRERELRHRTWNSVSHFPLATTR